MLSSSGPSRVATVEVLAWDTEFFGTPIGRVDLTGVDAAGLAAVDAQARDLGLRCLYGSHPPDPAHLSVLVQSAGWLLVEVSLTFERRAGEPLPVASPARVRRGTPEDLPGLAGAIAELAPWSRFAADPRFGLDAARAMHEAWVRRAAESTDDQWMLAVAEDDDGITAFATNTRLPRPRVDLQAALRPGTGVSQALMAENIAWGGPGPLEAGPIAARNVACLRFVEGCGFRVSEVRYLYHRWLDGGGPT